ncbi:MAG: permease prefix domain 1-containing protein [Acidobacteriota bacterium]
MNGRLLKRFGRSELEREIDEELAFHLQLLTQKNLQEGMRPQEAKDEAVKRFGNVDQIKGQCLVVAKRQSPLLGALKVFLNIVFLSGVLLLLLSANLDIRHIGQLLIVLPVLGRFLLHVRGLTPSRYMKQQPSSPLTLDGNAQTTSMSFDHRLLTLRERVRSTK